MRHRLLAFIVSFLGCGVACGGAAHTASYDHAPFACGAATTCTSTQFCWEHDVGGILYACPELTPPCSTTPTCACVLASFGPGALCASPKCTDDGAGHVTVLCVG